MLENIPLRTELYNKCLEYIENRLNHIQSAMNAALESGNDETKSSAGDKHETARAMMQLEQEKNANILAQTLELKKTLNKINLYQQTDTASLGNIIITNKEKFYISISAGKITFDNEIYYAISPLSPIALKLMGLKANQEFIYNEKLYLILQIL